MVAPSVMHEWELRHLEDEALSRLAMNDHEYEGICSKRYLSLINQTTTLADSICNNIIMDEGLRSATVSSPSVPLNLATEHQSQMTISSSDVLHLQSSSIVSYDGNQLQGTSASQHVVMVAGLDEAVKLLLSSQCIDGGGGAVGEEVPYGVGYGEAVMMFPGSETVQTATADYLDFSEPTDSLHDPEGVVQYRVDANHHHHHEEDESETHSMNEISAKESSSSGADTTAALMLGQTTVLVSESTKSTMEGFLSGVHNRGVQRVNSSELPQQVIHVVDVIPTTGPNMFRLVPNPDGTVSFVSFPPQLNQQEQDEEDAEIDGSVQFMQVQAVDTTAATPPGSASFIVPIARQIKTKKRLPPGCPSWASALIDCERIGDSFRGWVETEMDLESVLTYFKQVTHSYWGTRQSPSQSKPSTRLMWKSQYVPFDGIPFINASSRAIVMECQYGPRRQSNSKKLSHSKVDLKKVFRQSCPARIYIKKVRKFPEFAVNGEMDKKQLKTAMDDAFHSLKETNIEKMGEDRYYVQLPTEAAHEFHSESLDSVAVECPRRLHPLVSDKLREIVSAGERRLYAIRNMLRRYVEKELFADSDKPPARHDLTYFPTVNDLQNNIHQAIHDMEAGILPFTPQVNMEIDRCNASGTSDEMTRSEADGFGSDCQAPHVNKVTVMLCAKPGEGGHHVISRVETVMSDGTVQISSSLPPELAHMISNVPRSLVSVQDTQQNFCDKNASATSESEIVSLSAADIHAVCKALPSETFEGQMDSVKFSATVQCESALKAEDEPVETADGDSHLSLDGSCGASTGSHLVEEDIVEQFCVTQHWQKDLEIATKHLIEDNMPANINRIKRKKLI